MESNDTTMCTPRVPSPRPRAAARVDAFPDGKFPGTIGAKAKALDSAPVFRRVDGNEGVIHVERDAHVQIS